MQLVDLYRRILQSLQVEVDEHNLLSFAYNDIRQPLTIEDRRLALPTREILNMGMSADIVPFHPLSESHARGESKVLQKLKSLVTVRLSQVLAELLHDLTEIAADTKRHSKLSPKAQLLLSAMPEADERTVKDMDRILEAMGKDPNRKLVSLYLKRGGHYHGRKMSRVAVINFPIFAEFENENRSVFGVSLRKKDFIAFKNLFLYLLPDLEEPDGYNAGSMSLVAPYLDSLIQSYVKVARALNAVSEVQKKHLEDFDSVYIDISWEEDVRDWGVYRDEIPPLADSMGVPLQDEGAPAAQPAAQAPEQVTIPVTHFQNAPQSQPQATSLPKIGMHKSAEELEQERQNNNQPQRTIDDILAANNPMYAAQRQMQQPAPTQVAPQMPQAPTGDYPGYHRGVPIQRMYPQQQMMYPQQPMMGQQMPQMQMNPAMMTAAAYGPPPGMQPPQYGMPYAQGYAMPQQMQYPGVI